MFGFINELDKPALLVSALYLSLFFYSRNKLAFLLIIQVLVLSNWSMFLSDSYQTLIVFYCMSTIISGAVLSTIFKSKGNGILLIAQSYFFLFCTLSYITSALYLKFENYFFYDLVNNLKSFFPFIFWPNLALNVIGLVKRDYDDGRHINNNNTAFRDNYLYDDSKFSGNMGYYEKRN